MIAGPKAPWPVELRILRSAGVLEIDFDDGETAALPAALLRALTPSAAERGHGARSDGPLPIDFDGVALLEAEPVGAYAVRLIFDDGHATGIYSWETLHRFGRDKDRLLRDYRRSLPKGLRR